MSNHRLSPRPQFSFGIELETIIIFHEAAIKPHLSNPNAYLVKLEADDELRDDLCPYGYSTLQFRSWAIANDGSGPEWIADPEATTWNDAKDAKVPLRPYTKEPLKLVQNYLNKMNSPWLQNVTIYFDGRFPYVKQNAYDEWTITGEPSLQGLNQEQKKDFLSKRGPRVSRSTKEDVSEMYDSWGIKLVSPVYSSQDQFDFMKRQITDLTRVIHAAGNNDQENGFMALCTEDCGLHIHINRELDIGTLKWLALTLVVYEEEILRLIPKYRRDIVDGVPGQPGMPSQIMSIRQSFYWANDQPILRQYFDSNGFVKTGLFKFKYRPVDQIYDMIFKKNLTVDADLEHLQKLIGESRSKLVNFTYLNRKNRPRTIEFRQHEGTLNALAIECWVRFCLGLVELAWDMANNGRCFAVNTWDDRIWIEDLFKEMNLEMRYVRWFRRKMKSFRDDGKPRALDHLYVRCEL